MKFELKPYKRDISDRDLIADVKKVAVEINKKTVTIDQYNEKGKFHASTLMRRFGNWFKVLKTAGLQPSRSPLNISEEDLFQDLE